jgi:hypothetical protein
MAQAGTIHRQAQDLRIALSQTLTKLSDELGLERPLDPRAAVDSRLTAPPVAPAPPAAAPPPAAFADGAQAAAPAPPPPPAAMPEPSPFAAGSAGEDSTSLLGRFARKRRRTDSEVALDEARIAIVQMLASGESRERIERRLREEFGIEDASAVFATPSGEPTP